MIANPMLLGNEVNYIHRAFDTINGSYVYWQAPSYDPTGIYWSGPPAFVDLSGVIIVAIVPDSGNALFTHRAVNTINGSYVYWQAPSYDPTGIYWVGPPAFGSLSQVVIFDVRSNPTPATPPVNTSSPVASGAAFTGEVLSCTTGVWSGTMPIAYTYQWYRTSGTGVVLLSGETASTYVVDPTTVGWDVFCIVAATNSAGSDSFASNNIGPIASTSSPPVNTVAPVASGVVRVGNTLTSTDGTWTGMPTPTFTYQWKRGGVDIGGATASTYVVADADIASIITCSVTATNIAGAVSQVGNSLASPWQPILAIKPNVLIFDGLDPYCMSGVSLGTPVATMKTINGVALGSQSMSTNRATRTSTGLMFDGTGNYYVFNSTVAGYYNNLTTYAIHGEGIAGTTTRYFYAVNSTATPLATRNARVSASASTSRNDHRTNTTQTILVGPATTEQNIIVRWEPANSALYDLTSGVVSFATAIGNPAVAVFDQMTFGSIATLPGFWTGTLSAWAVDSSAWTTGDMAIYRACAVDAGVMV